MAIILAAGAKSQNGRMRARRALWNVDPVAALREILAKSPGCCRSCETDDQDTASGTSGAQVGNMASDESRGAIEASTAANENNVGGLVYMGVQCLELATAAAAGAEGWRAQGQARTAEHTARMDYLPSSSASKRALDIQHEKASATQDDEGRC